MKLTSFPSLTIVVVLGLLCCSPKPYNAVMVRPASCSHHVQFAECASLGHLLEFADVVQKPVFMVFQAPWIESCKRLEQYTFTQPDLAALFNTHFINYKININDAGAGQELANRYGVVIFPTLLFVDGKGKVMRKHEGPITTTQLMEMGYFIYNSVAKEIVSMNGED